MKICLYSLAFGFLFIQGAVNLHALPPCSDFDAAPWTCGSPCTCNAGDPAHPYYSTAVSCGDPSAECSATWNCVGNYQWQYQFTSQDILLENTPPNLHLKTRFPVYGDPENTDPGVTSLPATCRFKGTVKNLWNIHGTSWWQVSPQPLQLPGPLPARFEAFGRNGVTCTTNIPGTEFMNTFPLPKCGSSTEDVNVAWTYLGNGSNHCANTEVDFTCTFPDTWSNCGGAPEEWQPTMYWGINDSSAIRLEACCCEGANTDCCNELDRRPVLVR